MTRRLAVAIVLAAAVLPRLAVLLVEREEILAALVEKSDRFAQTLVASGTFGFLPGRPSGYTQPLYAWFLAGLYQVFERHWLVVGVAHIVLAALTALLVLEIGRRVASLAVGVVGATIATLHPFLVWHDMHLNREVLDGLLLAVVALLAVLAAERASKLQLATSSDSAPAAERASKLQVVTSWLVPLALGLAVGLAILGNARLALLPLALAAFVAWPFRPPGRALVAAGAVLVGAILVVTPWMARNEASVGCFVLTTDTRALWKANNENTYETLARGDWIDDVPEPPNGPPWPELAADKTLAGEPTEVDECEQQRYYRELVFDFWRAEPGEKARLSAQAVGMLWSPTFSVDSDDGGRGRVAELGRDVVEPVYMVAVYVLALVGAFFVPRRFLALVLLLEAYSTLAAMAFAGTVRYRAPFDFLLALLAAAAIVRALEWWRRR
jgi:4-amino-4-deoxy-L-arabinose transferase-like glycosyltransferase